MAKKTEEQLFGSGKTTRRIRHATMSQLAYTCARYVENSKAKTVAIVFPNDELTLRFQQDCRVFGVHDVWALPGGTHPAVGDLGSDDRDVFMRNAWRAHFLFKKQPAVTAVSASALMRYWMPEKDFAAASCTVRVGDHIPRQKLVEALLCCGFRRVSEVEDQGTFALRGGFVDVWIPENLELHRIDTFGDEITDILTATKSCAEIQFYPIREVCFTPQSVSNFITKIHQKSANMSHAERLSLQVEQHHYFYAIESYLSYFYEGIDPLRQSLMLGSRVVWDVAAVKREILIYDERANAAWSELSLREDNLILKDALGLSGPDVVAWIEEQSDVQCVNDIDDRSSAETLHEFTALSDLERHFSEARKGADPTLFYDALATYCRREQGIGQCVVFSVSTEGKRRALQEALSFRGVRTRLSDNILSQDIRQSSHVLLVHAGLSQGLRDQENKRTILTDREVFGSAPLGTTGTRRTRDDRKSLGMLARMREGDPVVHVDHGVGIYRGLCRLTLHGVDGDFVHLTYADGDILYVPVFRTSLLKKYPGATFGVRVDKLGGNAWSKTKSRVRDAVLDLAHELIKLQAQRQSRKGFKLLPPDDGYRQLEASFPYDETPDQRAAINDILADLQRDRPMDRLLCGDVGFGKTEVAIRAAYLAVASGHQVAVLVPTTVLAEQHGATFSGRLSGLGVEVRVLSRFRTTKEAQEIVEGLSGGRVDIIIGTHRLLGSHIRFSDLGLLVIDEEQRFGVRHKEALKKRRATTHILSMSATPIPRTLNMALAGLRDLSILSSPPEGRLNVHTEVTRFSTQLLEEVIGRELVRGGQVFFVHNRVETIDTLAGLIQETAPSARIAVCHGQMPAARLEEIMVAFIARHIDVLVCTAIIESGIDIPSANTMMINRADCFGLSQLYQLRGRIGRGRDRGYAYLLLPNDMEITDEAQARLETMKRFCELGSGYGVASHDLEQRGGGDLLGSNQSGHVAAVGLELYSELLAEALQRAKNTHVISVIDPEIQVPFTALLSEVYIADPGHRLDFYDKLSSANEESEIDDVFDFLKARYGHMPEEAIHLREVMLMRCRMKKLGATHLRLTFDDENVRVLLTFSEGAPVDTLNVALLCQQHPESYMMQTSGRLLICSPREGNEHHVLITGRKILGVLRVMDEHA